MELPEVTEVWEHVYELYLTKSVDNQDLGYVDRTQNQISVTLPNSQTSVSVTQSLSQLSSNSSSTGFVCWRTSQLVVDWILSNEKCPFYSQFHDLHNLDILELGAGISGVCGSILGPLTKRYVCSDQKPVLKLLTHNLRENISGSYNSTSLNSSSKNEVQIEVIEFDWEYPEEGLENYHQITPTKPNLILAFDTIYNEYLIEPFLNTLLKVMSEDSGCLMGIHMRDDITLEAFLTKTIEHGFRVYVFPDSLLSEDLHRGFVVYYIKK